MASASPPRRCRFRPCIDLRGGAVVQIVGGTLRDSTDGGGGGGDGAPSATTNFTAALPSEAFAERYRAAGLAGGHVIMLGGGAANEAAARAALAAFPGGLQVGGGVTPASAPALLAGGASHVIVTSYVFRDGRVDRERLAELVAAVGRERLVLDLSCRRRRRRQRPAEADAEAGADAGAAGVRDGTGNASGTAGAAGAVDVVGAGAAPAADEEFEYVVVTDRWQTWTDCVVDAATLRELAQHCCEFLVHGVDVEGLRQGVEDALVELLGRSSPIPATYAGGVRNMADVERVERLGGGRVDVSVGSALDIFGGDLSFDELVRWSKRHDEAPAAAAQ